MEKESDDKNTARGRPRSGLAVASAGTAMATQQPPYRLSDQQLKDLVNGIDTHGDAFRASVERAIDRSPINDSPAED